MSYRLIHVLSYVFNSSTILLPNTPLHLYWDVMIVTFVLFNTLVIPIDVVWDLGSDDLQPQVRCNAAQHVATQHSALRQGAPRRSSAQHVGNRGRTSGT
jgi:hypothetical protein